MKKLSLLLIIFILALPTTAGATDDPLHPFSVESGAALVMDHNTGQILYAQNIDSALPPASITKLMTMHLIFEGLAAGNISLDDPVEASAHATDLPPDASTIFLGTGEILPVEELLRAIAIISANDAGIAMAEYIAGSEQAFVEQMNEKASELGLENTHFINSHGLDEEGHHMSARDIALLSRETIRLYPEILQYSSQKYYRMERDTRYIQQGYFDLHSTFSALIGWRNIDGLKTGWTPIAKRGITATAENNHRRLYIVVLGAETVEQRDEIVHQLLRHGMDQFTPAVPIAAGTEVDTIRINNAKEQTVPVATGRDVEVLWKTGMTLDDVQQKITILPDLSAPLNAGEKVGELSLYWDDHVMTTIDLVTKQRVEQANFFVRALRTLSQNLVQFGHWLADKIF